MSDTTRLSVVERLMAEEELLAGALVQTANMSAPAMSRHLKVLREAGLERLDAMPAQWCGWNGIWQV